MYSVIEQNKRCYLLPMQPEQIVIANWLERTRQQMGWSWSQWAKKAGVGAGTTLTRAIKDDYKSVTSIPTLHALAQAAEVPSVLDFLSGQTIEKPVNVEALTQALTYVLKNIPKAELSDQLAGTYVRAALHALELVDNDPVKIANPDVMDVAARGAISRSREAHPSA